MNLLKSTRWAAITIGLLSGSALAATSCLITPAYSIITEGQTLQLTAVCTGDTLTSIDWKMDTVSVTGPVSLTGYVAGEPIKYTTPVGLGDAKETQEFVFTVGGAPGTVTTTNARVVVKPSSAVLALAKIGSSANTSKTPGECGTADGSAVTAMPTGTAQCAIGSAAALPISGPQSFTWSCLSLTGGAEASCYAMRGYTVTAAAGANGSISPVTQGVTAGGTASVSATPSTGFSAVISGCGGTQSGNDFTTGPVTANCTVTANFTNAPVAGTCGSAAGVTTTSAPSANLCSSGSATSVATATASYGWSCAGANGGSTASCSAPRAFTVSATAGANGSISPASKDVVGNTSTTFTVTPAAGYAASVSGCSGMLSGNTYTTGAITAACTVSATFAVQTVSTTDPGIGAGLWVPPNMPNRTVADQSSSGMSLSYVPGCLNGQFAKDSSSACAVNAYYTGSIAGTTTSQTVTMGSGKQLVLRYKTPATITDAKTIKVSAWNGGNVAVNMKTWLSTSPTASYETVPTACRALSTTSPMISTASKESITTTTTGWFTSTTTRYYCQLAPNTVYYFGIEFPEVVSGSAARFQVDELSADFLP